MKKQRKPRNKKYNPSNNRVSNQKRLTQELKSQGALNETMCAVNIWNLNKIMETSEPKDVGIGYNHNGDPDSSDCTMVSQIMSLDNVWDAMYKKQSEFLPSGLVEYLCKEHNLTVEEFDQSFLGLDGAPSFEELRTIVKSKNTPMQVKGMSVMSYINYRVKVAEGSKNQPKPTDTNGVYVLNIYCWKNQDDRTCCIGDFRKVSPNGRSWKNSKDLMNATNLIAQSESESISEKLTAIYMLAKNKFDMSEELVLEGVFDGSVNMFDFYKGMQEDFRQILAVKQLTMS